MSIQRYDFDDDGCVTDDDGIFVMFDDHAAAIAEKDAEISVFLTEIENLYHWFSSKRNYEKIKKVVEAAREHEEAKRTLGVASLFCDEASNRLENYVNFSSVEDEDGFLVDLSYLIFIEAYNKWSNLEQCHRMLLRVYEQRLSFVLAELEEK